MDEVSTSAISRDGSVGPAVAAAIQCKDQTLGSAAGGLHACRRLPQGRNAAVGDVLILYNINGEPSWMTSKR